MALIGSTVYRTRYPSLSEVQQTIEIVKEALAMTERLQNMSEADRQAHMRLSDTQLARRGWSAQDIRALRDEQWPEAATATRRAVREARAEAREKAG